MHEVLHAPDAVSGGVGVWGDGPGWKLLGEGAHGGPVAGTGEGDGFGGGGAEGGELGGVEEGGDEHETVAVESVEVFWLGHCGGD